MIIVPGVRVYSDITRMWDTMPDPLDQRRNERKIYEEIVNIIVDYVYKEFNEDVQARLRIYTLIAENFKGMVEALKPPTNRKLPLINLEYGEPDAVE